MNAPLTVACGLGVDSVAVLVEFVNRGIRPDLILFADTGGEKPETYAYLDVLNAFLSRHGFPMCQVVKYQPVRAPYDTLEGNCLANDTLPSLAFGRKACSDKFKVRPQHKFMQQWEPARQIWAAGGKVRKVIGYDAGPKDARRSEIADDTRYTYEYPLREWGWDRARCLAEIIKAGLPVPMKSACFFCPANKPVEVIWLAHHHPDLFRRAIEMEDNARTNDGLKVIEGLWRSSSKKRPGSWRVFALQQNLITVREDGGFDLVALDPAACPQFPEEILVAGCAA